MITWFSHKNKETNTSTKKSDDFVSLASHELRSPLSIIKWYTEILLDEDAGPLTEDQRKYLSVIESSNQRAIDLVRSLLNVSRLDLGTFRILPEEVLFKSIVDEAVGLLAKEREEKHVEIIQEIKDVPKIQADKHLLLMVIKNLLSNAIAFSDESGRVTIEVSVVKQGEMVGVHTVEEESILITISDQGIGIPEKDVASIFSKMFRASNVGDSHGEGSGLGLYITKSILEHVQGQVWFTSEVGKGSQFFVTLPVQGMQAKEGRTTLD